MVPTERQERDVGDSGGEIGVGDKGIDKSKFMSGAADIDGHDHRSSGK